MAVSHSQEDSVPNVEDFPVSSPKSLWRKKPPEKLSWTWTSICDASAGKQWDLLEGQWGGDLLLNPRKKDL